jgi:DNA-binding NtrC family response regulator
MLRNWTPRIRWMALKMTLRRRKMAKILIVDDQPHIMELLEEELGVEEHQITSIRDSNYVMDCLEESKPDLVLLDLYMKGFEGWNLLDQIKRHDPDVPVLIVSAYDTFRGDPRLARADGYVIKSFDMGELKEKIHETLDVRLINNKV